MDIRTSVVRSPLVSKIYNNLMRFESFFFPRISILSESLIEFLKMPKQRCRLLPLGGDKIDFQKKDLSNISLLYVGTFYDRYIEKTIEGLALYLKEYPSSNIKYSIIGFGSKEEVARVIGAIEKFNMSNIVSFYGEKRHEELIPFYASHNVGVSYIPLTDYYQCQPPTKTFEYLLNTMLVIATPTFENKRIVSKSMGVIMKSDTPKDFKDSLLELINNREKYDFHFIHYSNQKYTWENVVSKYLIPIIEESI